MDKTLIIDLNDINPFVRQAGIQEDCWPNHDRRIYDHELFYCEEGTAHMTINGQDKLIKKGALVLVKPNTPTRLWFNDIPPKMYWIHFDFLYVDSDPHIHHYLSEKSNLLYSQNLPDDYLIRPTIMFANGFVFPDYLIVNAQKDIKNLFIDIIKTYNANHFYWHFDCKIYLLQLFKHVLTQIYPDTMPANNQMDITRTILHYIHNHYYAKISLEEIANYIGLSKDYIGKIFKSNTGKSIITYVNIYRIQKAKQLLKYSDLSINAISQIIGFHDQYYFSRQMKKLTGYSPIKWRKKFEEDSS